MPIERITRTSAGATPIVPSGTSDALARNLQGILNTKQYNIEREERAKREAKQDENWLLENMKIDPVTTVTAGGAQLQGKWMEDFQNKWGSVPPSEMTSYKNKAQMMAEKQKLISDQAFLQAKEQEYYMAREMMGKDYRGYWDKNNANEQFGLFEKSMVRAATTGNFDDIYIPAGGFLRVAPMSYTDTRTMLSSVSESRGWTPTIGSINADGTYSVTKKYNVTEAENRALYDNTMLFGDGSDSAWMGLAQRFSKSTDKQYYLNKADTDNNGVDETERKNAILEWGWENEGKQLFPLETSEEKRGGQLRSDNTDNLTAEQKNNLARIEARRPENVAKNGYASGNGYWFVPIKDGYDLGYAKELDVAEKKFQVPSDVVFPNSKDYIIASDEPGELIDVKPEAVSKNGDRVVLRVPVYKREDLVTTRTAVWKKYKRQDNVDGIIINVEDDKIFRYIKKRGQLYRLSEEPIYVEGYASYNDVRDKFSSYFVGLDDAINYNKNAQSTTTKPEEQANAQRESGVQGSMFTKPATLE